MVISRFKMNSIPTPSITLYGVPYHGVLILMKSAIKQEKSLACGIASFLCIHLKHFFSCMCHLLDLIMSTLWNPYLIKHQSIGTNIEFCTKNVLQRLEQLYLSRSTPLQPQSIAGGSLMCAIFLNL